MSADPKTNPAPDPTGWPFPKPEPAQPCSTEVVEIQTPIEEEDQSEQEEE